MELMIQSNDIKDYLKEVPPVIQFTTPLIQGQIKSITSQTNSLKEIIQDYTRRKSINFTNVKKEKGKNAKKSHFYDVENIALGYAYTETNRRNSSVQWIAVMVVKILILKDRRLLVLEV